MIRRILKKYEIMVILKGRLNDSELKDWSFNYAKSLKKFNVHNISAIARGEHQFHYPIKDTHGKGHYIQLNITSKPKYLRTFLSSLKNDQTVLRYMIINK